MNSNILNHKTFINSLNTYGTSLLVNTKAMIANDKILKHNKPHVSYVVKNNAYGLGVEHIAPILDSCGTKIFFVATFSEALALRAVVKDATIYVFNGPLTDNVDGFIEYNIIPVLNTLKQVTLWHNYAVKIKRKLNTILSIETGINRLGLETSDVDYLYNHQHLLENFHIDYIMSHFACSDIENHPSIEEQYDNFVNLIKKLPQTQYSLSASCGVFLDAKYYFNLSRIGIAVYGANPTPYTTNPMQPVIFLYSTIQQIKHLKVGEHVGYGYVWQAKRPTKLAVLPIGYADGVMRSMSNQGFVYIDEYKAPMVGLISMDLITIDVTDIPEKFLQIGQPVELIGNQISINSFATNANGIHCEVLNLLTTRYPRIYSEM